MRQLRRWKRRWRRSLTRSHKRTSMLLEQCKCIADGGDYLEWGLEFHVCTINKSDHTKKSGNLFNDPRISLSLPFPGLLVDNLTSLSFEIFIQLFCDTMSWIYGHTYIHTCKYAPIHVCVCGYIYTPTHMFVHTHVIPILPFFVRI